MFGPIRPVSVGDIANIAFLEMQIFGADAWNSAQVVEEVTGPRRRGWVTADGSGYVLILEGDITDLQRIAVAPWARRQGIAGHLLERAMFEAEGERMLLEVAEDNAGAIALYERAGFVTIDRRERYYRNGAAALVMEARLTTQLEDSRPEEAQLPPIDPEDEQPEGGQ